MRSIKNRLLLKGRKNKQTIITILLALVAARFFWNPAPLMQNYMIKSVKMTKKSILRDQFSWKVRNFAQNLCENGLHLGKERTLCTRFAPSLQRK